MIGNLKRGEGGLLLLAAFCFLAASFPVSRAIRYANAASSERAASTEHLFIRYSSNFKLWKSNGVSYSGWYCKYDFTAADGASHNSSGACPQWIVEAAQKTGLDPAQVAARTSVFYDPNNPSINSLLDFHTARRSSLQDAVPSIGLGTLLALLFVFARLMTANERTGRGGVIVDNYGTVIHPEEIDLDSKEFDSRTNGAVKSPAPSQELRELYRELVKKIHPDRAANESDRTLRERLTKSANAAFERSDTASLRQILEEYSRKSAE